MLKINVYGSKITSLQLGSQPHVYHSVLGFEWDMPRMYLRGCLLISNLTIVPERVPDEAVREEILASVPSLLLGTFSTAHQTT